MYGFVNHALQLLVLRNFGEETWEKIKKEANVSMEGEFLHRQIYCDSMSYNLVGAAEKILGISANNILELFGRVFFKFCQEQGYDKILMVLGSTVRDFLQNLDALHDHLGTIYPGMKAPHFRVSERESDGATILHYTSERDGLEHIVIGIVKAVSEELHSTEVDVSIYKAKGEDGIDHVQFLIEEKKDGSTRRLSNAMESELKALVAHNKKIKGRTICNAFPFHFVIDNKMRIIEMGDTLARLFKKYINKEIFHLFEMIRPNMNYDFQSILAHINTVYVMKIKQTAAIDSQISQIADLRIKGQMTYIIKEDSILFLGSPCVASLDDLLKKGLHVGDIPVHDATRDLLLLSENFQAEYKLTQNLEILTDDLKQARRDLESEKQKTDNLMYSVLPPSVANELRQQNPVEPYKYNLVTILFSGIVGFDEFSSRNSDVNGAAKIIKLLNDCYTKFDELIDPLKHPAVYKVETVGDKYMAVSGLPEECPDHSRNIALLALDMMETIKNTNDPDGKPLQITVGIHSGEVVTGVIGTRMPRYCLFGNTVNLTSRTETTGTKGKINVSEDAYKLLQSEKCYDPDFQFEYRGTVKMKGRENDMKCWFLTRKSWKK
ncbi:DgyrCDS5256 [Dimorphilus gyrociliatus]|uniref:Guanylate cyclase soluble subunit beta-1 n=1 Tax=Dimorphilus gyrociliatus TaxID=2664684 RepID=A0A7I8VJB9_9ANNE|nr:DgyrCDS5256 [Dimorphilus gyrociliatus]